LAWPSTVTTTLADSLPDIAIGTSNLISVIEAAAIRAAIASMVTLTSLPAKRSPLICANDPGATAGSLLTAAVPTALITGAVTTGGGWTMKVTATELLPAAPASTKTVAA